jgi:uncharacterized cupredoxin-like copper-binding protein
MAAIALLPLSAMAQRGDTAGPVASLRADTRYFTVGSHFFAPADITVETGRAVHLVVVNGSPDHMHDFVIVSASGELVGGRAAVIEPGQRVEFDWTPLAPGLYRILCAVCPAEEGMLALVHVH